jgi:anthranilate phosphoribosyltransferase
LARKGETAEELVGFAEALRARMVTIPTSHRIFVDTAGTGASRAKTFNVSTAAAIVAAAAGVPVTKHGGGAASSKFGSADVMRALGVRLPIAPELSGQLFESLGFCFLFAPAHHPALARVSGIRRELGIRTCFNLVGPLSNPARASRHVLGVSDRKLLSVMADSLAALGAERAWVVHGSDGLDEITLAGPTCVAELREGRRFDFEISPQDFGLRLQPLESAYAADAADSARIIKEVFAGRRRDVARDLIVVNAAAAMHVGGRSGTLKEYTECAAAAIEGGLAARKLEAFVSATNAAATVGNP